jgi:hypothetical protein
VNEDIELFLGAAVLVLVFACLGYFVPVFQAAAINGLSALIGAAAMKMKGNT